MKTSFPHFLSVALIAVSLVLAANFIDHEPEQNHLHNGHNHQPTPNQKPWVNDPHRCERVNVHLIPHSHDDVGWLKTVDEYYYGLHNENQKVGVEYIIESVIGQLMQDKKRRFIFVEVAYFKKWWNEQNEDRKALVRELAREHRLEFVNGGLCMNDEATAYYEDIIDQMTYGHRFLKAELNVTPTIGWHIDPFGHSAAQASLFAYMGMDAWFPTRIDYQDKQRRMNTQEMEMVMKPDTAMGDESAIFTHVNYHHYEAPPTFCFDQLCNDGQGPDQEIIDNAEVEGFNIHTRALEFANYFKHQCEHYRSNHVMHTMGSDFHYQNAARNFKNMDRLLKEINNNASYGINIFYSTPSYYVKQIHNQKLPFPEKRDDFFPYSDTPWAYWVGYFTSRSTFKYFIRESGRFLQVYRKYLGFHGLRNTSNVMTTEFKRVAAAINKMEEAVGINQHHDAITGTAKQHVTDNYIKILNDGTEILRSIVHEVAAEQTSNEIKEDVQYEYCSWNTTSSACEITSTNLTNNEAVLLAVFNPAAARKSVIRVKVPHGNLSVIDMENDELTVDVICPEEDDDSDCDLFFFTSLPAFDMSYFKIVPSDDSKELTGKPARTWSYHSVTYRINDEETLRFLTKLNEFEIKRCSRRHSAIHNKPVGHCSFQKLVLDYNYYPSGQRNAQNSGAYVFVNEENIKEPKPYVEWNSATVYEGQVVVQMYYPLTTIVASLRIYRNMSEAYELETYVAPLNTTGTFGSEIVLRLTTLIENEGIFYTDSNGMEMQMRVINNRPSWKWNLTETVAGNYYPVQSAIQIRDKSNRGMLTVVPDRAQGGTSLNPGQVELMIQRKLEVDDGRGVGEALKEDHFIPNTGETVPIIATMIHRIILTKPGEWEYDWRNVQWDQDQPNILMLAPTDTATFNITTRKPQSQNFGFKQLPRLVKVWIRPYDEKVFVVRFQNMGDKKTEEVIVDDKWTHMNWDERSLTTNQQKKIMHAKRMRWNDMQAPPQENKDYKDGNIRLRPQEIRTFVVWNY